MLYKSFCELLFFSMLYSLTENKPLAPTWDINATSKLGMVEHLCNPSTQEDLGWRLAWAI